MYLWASKEFLLFHKISPTEFHFISELHFSYASLTGHKKMTNKLYNLER